MLVNQRPRCHPRQDHRAPRRRPWVSGWLLDDPCVPACQLTRDVLRSTPCKDAQVFQNQHGGPAIRRQRLGSSQRNTPGLNRRFETTDIHRMRLSARPSPNVSPDRPDCPNTWLCGKGLSVRDRFDGFTDLELSGKSAFAGTEVGCQDVLGCRLAILSFAANSRGYFDQTVAPSLSASSGHTTISSEVRPKHT